MSEKHYTDKEIVEGILSHDNKITLYFFQRKCVPVFDYILRTIFDNRVDKNELVNELYIYLQAHDWHKLRQFDYQSKLTTWISVVAVRFFQRRRNALLGKADCFFPGEESGERSDLSTETDIKLDVQSALQRMRNERYRKVIQLLDLEGRNSSHVAEEMHITVFNLYNIHRRARVQLAFLLGKELRYD